MRNRGEKKMATKRMYLEQQRIPLSELPPEKRASETEPWPFHYFVKRVVGSTTPKIREFLSEAEVQGYCENDDWTVEIT